MDWVYLHLALNHVPVLGTGFVVFLVAWSWRKNNREALRLSLWLCILLSVSSIAIKFTGDFALQAIGKPTPDYNHEMIRRHEQSADQAATGVFALGIVAALAVFVSRNGRPAPKWALAAVILVGLCTFALMARTANYGGHIRHSEIQSGVVQTP